MSFVEKCAAPIGDEYFAQVNLNCLDIVTLDVEGMEANVVMGMANIRRKRSH